MILGVSEDRDVQGLQMVPDDYILGLPGKQEVLVVICYMTSKVMCTTWSSHPCVRGREGKRHSGQSLG